MSEALHPLAERYLDALYELPDSLRVRREHEDALAATLTGGHHVCIRGFWRVGKTTLMKGALERACERTSGAAFVLDLRDPGREDGLPTTADSVLARVAAKVDEFLKRVGATELKASRARPLEVLGELAAPLFVGFDELVALSALPAGGAQQVIEALLAAPRNVKVVVVCHRHRDMDALFEKEVLSRPGLVEAVVGPITDEELVHLVNTPAQAEGVTFENEALGALAEATGNRPWEVFSLCAILARGLPKGFQGTVGPDQVDALLDLDVLGATDEGQALIDTYLRILVTAMSPEERTVLELLATGKEGEAPEAALASLEAYGWLATTEEGTAITSGLMEGIALAVGEGAIKVSVG